MRPVLFFLLLLPTSLSFGQSLDQWQEIAFQSQSRSGDFKEIRFTPDSVYYRSGNYRSGQPPFELHSLSREEKVEIQNILAGLEGIEIAKLAAPSNKRAFDGAAHSQIIIKTKDRQFDHYFDNESPHEALRPLLKWILGLIDAKE